MLDRGVHRSVTEVIEAERISRSHLSRPLRRTLLAPDVVGAVALHRGSPVDVGPQAAQPADDAEACTRRRAAPPA
jgi:hypothetical protein